MKIGLVAGEASGDLLGAGLIEAIRTRIPDAVFEGVAGPAMQAAGCETWESADTLAVMGLVEPLKVLPKLLALRRRLVRQWLAKPPDVFVGIDAPDFNLGLEARLRRGGIATAHYVSPSVWAWREGRIRKIRKAADLVLCLLPFEKAFYDRHDVWAEFVGHPKADSAPQTIDVDQARTTLGIAEQKPVVAILPGSRQSEVQRLGGVFAQAAARIREQLGDVSFVLPLARPSLRPMVEQQLADAGLVDDCLLLDGDSELAMRAADVVLLASGTAALEAALLQRPMVAAYAVAPATAWLVRRLGLLKISQFTLPNLLTKEPQVTEFIQEEVNAMVLADAVVALLLSPERRAGISANFAKLRAELARNASERSAEAVLSLAANANNDKTD